MARPTIGRLEDLAEDDPRRVGAEVRHGTKLGMAYHRARREVYCLACKAELAELRKWKAYQAQRRRSRA